MNNVWHTTETILLNGRQSFLFSFPLLLALFLFVTFTLLPVTRWSRPSPTSAPISTFTSGSATSTSATSFARTWSGTWCLSTNPTTISPPVRRSVASILQYLLSIFIELIFIGAFKTCDSFTHFFVRLKAKNHFLLTIFRTKHGLNF